MRVLTLMLVGIDLGVARRGQPRRVKNSWGGISLPVDSHIITKRNSSVKVIARSKRTLYAYVSALFFPSIHLLNCCIRTVVAMVDDHGSGG